MKIYAFFMKLSRELRFTKKFFPLLQPFKVVGIKNQNRSHVNQSSEF